MAIAKHRSKRTIKRRAEMPKDAALERTERAFNLYTKAFSGFSDEEIAILDGVVLVPPRRRRAKEPPR
jgi:hypothetical protein